MNDVELESLGIGIGVFDEGNSSLEADAVGVVNEGPDSLDVSEVDILDDIDFSGLGIAGGEVVVSLTLPNGELPISHSDVVIRLVLGEPGNEIPGLVFSLEHSLGIGGKESHPESVAVLL